MRFDVVVIGSAYVVVAFDRGLFLCLRSFGLFQSAALEFCRFCRENVDEMQARRYAATFKESQHYYYPSIVGGRAVLRLQRDWD